MKKLLDLNGLLLLIVLFATCIRVWQLGEMPAGFHRDEVLSGYIGTFIVQNGIDIYGNPLPLLYVDKYGDYPPALPMYLSGISNYLFGVSVLNTRLPVALVSVLFLIPFFFLTKTIFQDKRIALFAVFLTAILPWHIVLSRATAEGIVALTIITWGLLHLFQFIKNQKPLFLIIACLLFLLTYFLYPSYRILVPLLLLPLPFLFPFKKHNKMLLIGGILFFFITTLLIASTVWGRGRFDQTSMFGLQSGGDIRARISILAQEEGHNRVKEVKSYHNKYILYSKEFLHQYLNYFSPQYLFLAGGLPYRYTVADQGLLYQIMFPLLFLSFVFLHKLSGKMSIYLLYLLIISPLPAPLTLDDVPNTHRTLFMIIPLVLLTSFGLFKFLDILKSNWLKKSIFVVVVLICFIELIYFLHMYFHHANAVKSFERGDTNKELMLYVISQQNNFDTIYMPVHDAFPFYYLFFTNNFDRSIANKTENNLIVKQLDTIVFTDTYCPSKEIVEQKRSTKNILILDRTECQSVGNLKLIKAFTRHDGTTSYRIYTSQDAVSVTY